MDAKLHVFDMDHTLIENDCDVSWKEFMIAEKIAAPEIRKDIDFFFDQYNRGCLDLMAFSRFQLKEFAGNTPEFMRDLCRKHFEKIVQPRIRPQAEKYIRELQANGKICALITSTNYYIAEPLGKYLGLPEIHGNPLCLKDGIFTGETETFYIGSGKADVLRKLCQKYGLQTADTAAYGDSINDLQMLETAGQAFAVSPSKALQEIAMKNKWTILDWRFDLQA